MNKANIVKDGDLNNLVEAGEYSVWNNVANIPTNFSPGQGRFIDFVKWQYIIRNRVIRNGVSTLY